MEEVWKEIKGYNGKYLISNYGRVKSLYTNKIIAEDTHSDGYLKVRLWKKNKRKSYLIHRLVAEYFLSNPLDLKNVNHVDGNKHNNHASNLKWASQRDVVNNAWQLGKAQSHKSGKVIVCQFDKKGTLIKEHNSIIEAANDVDRSTQSIKRALNGLFKTSAGYIWKYGRDVYA